jgi:hypothetical protein
MLFKNFFCRVLITLPLLSVVSGFGITLFTMGSPIYARSSVSVVFTSDSPKLVTFKIAVQNKDNTLTSIESSNAYNMMTGDFISVSIPESTEPGINYWFVAVDNDNASNYATFGPVVIRKMFSYTNPSASITANSDGTAYNTGGSLIASSTGSNSATSIPTSANSSPTTSGKVSNTSTENKSTSTSTGLETHSHPNIGAIVGGAGGGAFALIIIIWVVLYVSHNYMRA